MDDRMRRDAARRACEPGRAPGTRTTSYVPRPKRATFRPMAPLLAGGSRRGRNIAKGGAPANRG